MAICPVCGYPDLEDNYRFEYCPCCVFQFNVTDHDKGFTYEQWRKEWISKGMLGMGKGKSPPSNWNPQKQLENLAQKT